MFTKKKIANMIFILALGSISAFLLLGIRDHTLPMIKRHEEIRLKEGILDGAGINYDETNLDRIFDNSIKKEQKDGFRYYISPSGFYIFEIKGRGLWGMIEAILTLGPDLETIQDINIIAQEETPGLGGRIVEDEFLDQFKGKKILPELLLALRRKASDINEVDAITGASMSSQAVVDLINKSVEDFRNIMRGQNAHK